MAKTPSRICIITNATICCNPRVVKEADALSAAGFAVRVVASQHVGWAADWDEELMRNRKWKLDSIRWDQSTNEARRIRVRSGLRQQGFALLARASNGWGFAERAYARLFNEQLAIATRVPADLFIAHNPQALPVAAAAAKHFGVGFAFDSEDFHTGEFPESAHASKAYRLLTHLEAKYLPQCVYVTSPSDPISRALAARYEIPEPITVANVFSWSDRNEIDGLVKDRKGGSLSLYWYSQIIGLDRGLQDVIRAASLLSEPVQIHLRGDMDESVKRELLRVAADYSVASMILFHKPVPPSELLSRAAEHDVGLALEQPVTENRQLTVTNKIFFYLLAGLAVAATSTRGQQAIYQTCSDAGFLYPPGDYKALAVGLQRFLDSPQLLFEAKTAALRAAETQWNWETESKKVVELVRSALGRHSGVKVATT